MKKIIFLLAFIALYINANAQEGTLEQAKKTYLNATPEERVKMDSLFQPLADDLQKQQVKTIGGIPFVISHEKAEEMLLNKFGMPEYNPSSTTLSYKNIKYAGRDFDAVHFLFQSDGINSYLNSCIFIVNANSLADAMEKEKNIAEKLLSKYKLYEEKDTNGIPVYSGGISPQWDGRWNTVDVDLFCGVHTDIIKYESKLAKIYNIPYAVRIVYGPYDYVNEEF